MNLETGKIGEIDPADAHTFENKLFLTFDLDWSIEPAVAHTLDMLDQFEVKSTWFITHETPILERMIYDDKVELGIHPNFNLLNELNSGYSARGIIENILEIVPGATSIRSHSLASSSRLKSLFKEYGLTHHCNLLIPFDSNCLINPWVDHYGLVEVPHLWEDDVHSEFLSPNSLLDIVNGKFSVVDFHPIHIYLNSRGMQNYEDSRPLHKNAEKLRAYREGARLGNEFGTEDGLLEILQPTYSPE